MNPAAIINRDKSNRTVESTAEPVLGNVYPAFNCVLLLLSAFVFRKNRTEK